MYRRLFAAVFISFVAFPLFAQTSITGAFPTVFPKPVLILDKDLLLRDSQLGEALLDDIGEKRQQRITENQAIANELETEEARLTELRQELSVEEFKALADAFDEKVQNIRDEQIAKDVALQREADQIPLQFIEIAAPFLNQLLIKYQAGAIVDRRATLLYNTNLDITAEAIILLDQAYEENPNIFAPKEQ